MASGSKSKNATPITAPALNPRIKCSLSRSPSASNPPARVLAKAAAAMANSNIAFFPRPRATEYIVAHRKSFGGIVSYDPYQKRKSANLELKPETQMMGYGYDPSLSEGSLKPPVFLTSTFVFKTAQDGKDFFDYTSGRREPVAGKSSGLVYSRFHTPNLG